MMQVMRKYEDLIKEVDQAKKYVASLRKEMTDGLISEVKANGGKIVFSSPLLLNKGSFIESQALDIYVKAGDNGKEKLFYHGQSTNKTTPRYLNYGANVIEEYIVSASLSELTEWVKAVEEERR